MNEAELKMNRGAMSNADNDRRSIKPYFWAHSSDQALAYDGMDIYDVEESDIELLLIDPDAVMGGLHIACVRNGEHTRPNLKMRRGVQPVNVLFHEEQNLMLISEAFFCNNEDLFTGTLSNMAYVDCNFGKRTFSYMAGNPTSFLDNLDNIDWTNSVFVAMSRTDHHMYTTMLGRGEARDRQLVQPTHVGIQVGNLTELRAEQRRVGFQNRLFPSKLSLRRPHISHILSWNYGQTIYSTEFVRAVGNGKKAGFYFSEIPINVVCADKVYD